MATPTDPEEIFEIQAKIGEGSYGSVVKALHKRANRLVAIKIVPVDSDLNELIKEISILKSCKSEYIVRYYGSYYKNNDLWIVMEYCGAGSLSDLMMKGRFTLKEDEIRYVISQMLLGIAYLHQQRKIHRDIKAGNVLLTEAGVAKLADFGVSVQLDSTLAKRKTVIGTPFWMAPEVIQEMDYDSRADIWSLGITAIELAEGVPPYSNIHPMRAIFMIPNRPPPRLQNESRWSRQFNDFISQCLVKDPLKRPTSRQLLDHPFVADTIRQLQSGNHQPQLMLSMITRLRDLKSRVQKAESQSDGSSESIRLHHEIPLPSHQTKMSSDGSTQGTMITKGTPTSSEGGTMVIKDMKPAPSTPSIIPLNSVTPPPNLHTIIQSAPVIPLRAPLSSQRQPVTPQPLPQLRTASSTHSASPLPSSVHSTSQLASNQHPATLLPNTMNSTNPVPNSAHSPSPVPNNTHSINQLPLPAKKPVNSIDLCTSSLLPELPTNRPSQTDTLAEWLKLQNKGKQAVEQFKEDLRILVGAYRKELDAIVTSMNSFV